MGSSLQAAQVVKICMVALDAGARKLMVGWAVDAQNPLAVSTLSHHGRYSITFKHLRPAAYTYNLLIHKLAEIDQVQRRRMPAGVYVHDCRMRAGRRVLVAFHDDHIGQNHDQPTGSMNAMIPCSARQVRITRIITKIGQTAPDTQITDVAGGSLRIKLTEYPVLIEPVKGR